MNCLKELEMNANELADEFKEENNDWNEDNLRHWGKQTEAMLRSQEAYINKLHKLCNLNGLGAGRNLLTGEIIPFEVNE